ncbi:MAG: hypothetical protein JNK24_03870 [Alphaproteobacteria bacterium]|nr:hypothetical protein [Alphaproteobacteria bacterium]
MSEGWFGGENRKLIIAVTAVALMVFVGVKSYHKPMSSAPTSSESAVLNKLAQAKRLNLDGSVGYNQSSYQHLAQTIDAADMPYLLNIISGKNPPSVAFIALGAKCDAGLDQVIAKLNDNEMSNEKAKLVLTVIQNFDGCSDDTKIMAARFEKSLSATIETALSD